MIRDAVAGDRAAWEGLWQGYLDYYQQPLAPAITAHTWARLMDPASPMGLRVAEANSTLVNQLVGIEPSGRFDIPAIGKFITVTSTARVMDGIEVTS